MKKTFSLPRTMMNNSDLSRIINSDEIQTKVRAAREGFAKPSQKRNPLKNLGTMLKLNPYIAQVIDSRPHARSCCISLFRISCSSCAWARWWSQCCLYSLASCCHGMRLFPFTCAAAFV